MDTTGDSVCVSLNVFQPSEKDINVKEEHEKAGEEEEVHVGHNRLIYGLTDKPAWHLSVLFAFQVSVFIALMEYDSKLICYRYFTSLVVNV